MLCFWGVYGVYEIFKVPGFAGLLWIFLFGICEHSGEWRSREWV
jgi:hypothetical protein